MRKTEATALSAAVGRLQTAARQRTLLPAGRWRIEEPSEGATNDQGWAIQRGDSLPLDYARVGDCPRILTEVVGKDFKDAAHLASYAGIAPVTPRSGTSIRGDPEPARQARGRTLP
jgi:hypothetical protein